MKQAEAGIIRIDLNTPTIHGAVLRPRPVNFLYGKNGTGKTSIGKAIADKSSDIAWADDLHGGAKVYLYNEAFIDNNVHSYSQMPGVYALSEENVEIRRLIDGKTKEKEKAEKSIREMKEELSKLRGESSQAMEENSKAIWRAAAPLRKRYELAIVPYHENVQAFADHLSEYKREDETKENMDISYQLAFSQEQIQYTLYQLLPPSLFPADDIMDIPIVSHTDSAMSVFFQALGNMDWVRSGHDAYGKAAGYRCPYCGQNLPEGFEEEFAQCLDKQYREKMDELRSFAASYQQAIEKAASILEINLRDASQDEPKYRMLAELLTEKANANYQIIQKKLNSPREELLLSDLTELLEQLNMIAKESNQKRRRYIEVAQDLPKARERCTRQVWQAIAARCGELQDLRDTMKKEAQEKERKLELRVQTTEGKQERLSQEINTLSRSMADTSKAMREINATLKTSGFTGFHFQEKEGHAYELVRDTQPEQGAAVGLSEGERRFVAFLYFFHTVMGSLEEDGEIENKVVVIDDPVCSLDSEVLAFVAALVRSLIQKCLDRYRCGSEDSHILQIFCLTHNPIFFRLISDSHIPDHAHCAYFEVRKNDRNTTEIIPCVARENAIGTEMVNRSPVTDEYQGLWRQFALSDQPQVLIATARQILCRYFLLTCHHDGREMQKVLLDEHKEAFAPPGSADWHSSFNIVSAMVSLMDLNSSGAMNSLYFDMSAVDPKQIRFVFQRIFEVMHQEQHYRHMLGTTEVV